MKALLANWKTSLPGFLALATVGWNAWQTKTISVPDLQAALVGVGLIAAKDFNVVGVPGK